MAAVVGPPPPALLDLAAGRGPTRVVDAYLTAGKVLLWSPEEDLHLRTHWHMATVPLGSLVNHRHEPHARAWLAAVCNPHTHRAACVRLQPAERVPRPALPPPARGSPPAGRARCAASFHPSTCSTLWPLASAWPGRGCACGGGACGGLQAPCASGTACTMYRHRWTSLAGSTKSGWTPSWHRCTTTWKEREAAPGERRRPCPRWMLWPMRSRKRLAQSAASQRLPARHRGRWTSKSPRRLAPPLLCRWSLNRVIPAVQKIPSWRHRHPTGAPQVWRHRQAPSHTPLPAPSRSCRGP